MSSNNQRRGKALTDTRYLSIVVGRYDALEVLSFHVASKSVFTKQADVIVDHKSSRKIRNTKWPSIYNFLFVTIIIQQ